MTDLTLADLGWRPSHEGRTAEDSLPPARLSGVERDRVTALTPDGPVTLTCPPGLRTGDLAVGDWVLFDPAEARIQRLVERDTLLSRKAAGRESRPQLIAANVDTLAIVSSCNADFNEARIERYLAMAATAGCLPLILLTKADMAEDPDAYRARATRLSPLAVVETVNARDPEAVARLSPWAGPGQTLALVGSSGTGKTTLTNGLTGGSEATQEIREDDARGRHTTTARHLHRTRAGGWIVDTPGMRELGLSGAAEGIDEVFSDIADLEAACRFSDCRHETEPGCAVKAALEDGSLDPERLKRWEKLRREDARNEMSLATQRARSRATGKVHRAAAKTRRDS